MDKFLKYILFLIGLFFSLLIVDVPSNAENATKAISLDAGHDAAIKSGRTVPIIGIRSASGSFVAADKGIATPGVKSTGIYIPESLVLNAWQADKHLAEIAKSAMKKSPFTSIEAFKNAGIDISTFDWSVSEKNNHSYRPIVVSDASGLSDTVVDPKAIIGMTQAGWIDYSNPKYINVKNSPVRAFELSKRFSDSGLEVYKSASEYSNLTLSNPKFDWLSSANPIRLASQKLDFQDVKPLSIQLGTATVGKIRILSADEAGFKVDKKIAATSDTYLLMFAVTFYDLAKSQTIEISFRANCETECTAWELAPKRVVQELEKTETTNTPPISAEGVSIGEFYRVTLTSKELKPQIISYGLQEDSFSWSLKDSAIESGSYNFAAAISVPKGTKSLGIDQSIALKMETGSIEKLWSGVEGNVASTRPVKEILSLLK